MIPKIADFGLSKLIPSAAMTHTAMGTPCYVAPEVRMELRYSFPADIFSLAMTLFEMFNERLMQNFPPDLRHFINLVVEYKTIGKIPESCTVPECLRSIIKSGWDTNPNNRPSLSDYRSALKGIKFKSFCEISCVLLKYTL